MELGGGSGSYSHIGEISGIKKNPDWCPIGLYSGFHYQMARIHNFLQQYHHRNNFQTDQNHFQALGQNNSKSS